jgi:hypothetical protein
MTQHLGPRYATPQAAAAAAAEAAIKRLPVVGGYRKFIPKIKDFLVISMPGETMRCPVEKVIDQNTVLFRVDSAPMAKAHNFGFDHIYGARRRVRDGRDVWEAQEERDFLREQKRIVEAAVPPKAVKPVEALKPKVGKKPAAKRVGKGRKRRVA